MNRFTLFLTKRYLRLINAEYSGVSKVSLPNNLEVEVVAFSSKKDYRLGQATITRAIIIHEKCFSNVELLHYVTAHEYGHHKSWYSFLGFPIIAILWLYGLYTLLYGLLTVQIDTIIFSLILVFAGCMYSWFIEYKAEAVAIKMLGVDQVIFAREQMVNFPKPPLSWRFLSKMTHPPFAWTMAIYKYFHKGNKDKRADVHS